MPSFTFLPLKKRGKGQRWNILSLLSCQVCLTGRDTHGYPPIGSLPEYWQQLELDQAKPRARNSFQDGRVCTRRELGLEMKPELLPRHSDTGCPHPSRCLTTPFEKSSPPLAMASLCVVLVTCWQTVTPKEWLESSRKNSEVLNNLEMLSILNTYLRGKVWYDTFLQCVLMEGNKHFHLINVITLYFLQLSFLLLSVSHYD